MAEVARSRELTPAGHQVQPQSKVKAKSFASCACNDPFQLTLSLSYALALSLRLSGLCRLVWLFPFPFCTLSTCATVAACCSLLCACSSCRLAFLFQAKKDEAMSEIFATLSLSLSIPRSLSSLWPLKLDSKVKFLPRVEWVRVVG